MTAGGFGPRIREHPAIGTTVSLYVASFPEEEIEAEMVLVERADTRVYEAKDRDRAQATMSGAGRWRTRRAGHPVAGRSTTGRPIEWRHVRRDHGRGRWDAAAPAQHGGEAEAVPAAAAYR